MESDQSENMYKEKGLGICLNFLSAKLSKVATVDSTDNWHLVDISFYISDPY